MKSAITLIHNTRETLFLGWPIDVLYWLPGASRPGTGPALQDSTSGCWGLVRTPGRPPIPLANAWALDAIRIAWHLKREAVISNILT